MGEVVVLILVAVGLAAIVGLVFLVRHLQYVRSLRDKGWTFTGSPTVNVAYGLNVPPFGIGNDRTVDDLIEGTAQGVPFRAFEYRSKLTRPTGYVVCMPLPVPLPQFVMMPPEAPRPGVVGTSITGGEPFAVVTDDPEFAQTVLARAGAALQIFAGRHRLDVSIDGNQLVAQGGPRDADELSAFADDLAGVARALGDAGLDTFARPAPPAEMSIYGHPDWVYRPQDDTALEQVHHSSGGYGHEARNVIFHSDAELPFVALTHHWKTDRQVTSRDSDGNTTTRTETDHHVEHLMEFMLPFPFIDLSLNGGVFDGIAGGKVRFESDQFNNQFAVRCANPRFASDVFHPRQIDYVMASRPPAFTISSGRMQVAYDGEVGTAQTWTEFAAGFFGRVPAFTWKELGVQPPQLMLEYEG